MRADPQFRTGAMQMGGIRGLVLDLAYPEVRYVLHYPAGRGLGCILFGFDPFPEATSFRPTLLKFVEQFFR
jgi:hypothetical protein